MAPRFSVAFYLAFTPLFPKRHQTYSWSVVVAMIPLSNFSRAAKIFARAEDGNIAVMFAIALLPMLAFVGAAIDYTRVNNARTAMQAALDSAALMISKDATTLSATDLTTRAQGYFNALYNHPEAPPTSFSATYTASTAAGSTVLLTASGSMPTDIMRIVGFPKLDFNLSSTAAWGTMRLRVALALDNTGSMSNAGKMTALKTAASSLVDQLSAVVKTAGDVYISIIPFATDVNIGTSFKTSPTMDWSNWSPTGSIEDTSNNWKCGSKYQAPSRSNNYQGTMVCGDVSNNVDSWNGCVMDRDKSTPTEYDTTNVAPSTPLPLTWIPADQSPWCPTQMMPLSTDWAGLKKKISNMQPNGATNQPIGFQWAWFSLTQGAPLNAPPKDPNYQYRDVIILLSDGLNTLDRWYGDGSNPSNATGVDDRQKKICDNIKQSGVEIYTILVNTDGDPPSAVMPYCASGSDHYFPTSTASGIGAAFSQILGSLTQLRIAK